MAFPHLTDGEIRALSLKVWDNLGRVMAEAIHLPCLRQRAWQSRRDYAGAGTVLTNPAHGLILASGHIGAYELVVMGGFMGGFEPTGVYQELSNPLVDSFLRDLRRPMFPGGLFPKSHKTARKVLSIVKAGGTAAFLADQREFKGIKITFFGMPAYCNPFPSLLARHCRAPLIAGRVIRALGATFIFQADEVSVPRTKDVAADIRVGTQRFHDLLEGYIREYPEQWMWTHRKWAMPPETEIETPVDATA